jgi:fructose-1,6-bisphosphatase/inositol monophosphatase family enzyme
VDDLSLLEVLFAASTAAQGALVELEDWGPNPERPGQYRLDVVADAAAVATLSESGLSILSEESGRTDGPLPLLAVLDPIDGSTNAHRGISVYSTSICVFDADGPRVGTVVNHSSGHRFHAIQGSGAWRDGLVISPSRCELLSEAVVGLSGFLSGNLGSWQYRTLGCASLELCAVAEGSLDAYVLGRGISLRPWDYLAGLLICAEAGASVSELDGRDLWVRSDSPRRPVAAASHNLLKTILSVAAG